MNTLPQTSTVLTRLPALSFTDDRIIIGSFIQFNGKTPDGWIWYEGKAPVPKNRDYLGLASGRALQTFKDGRPEVIGAELGSELPDLDELNAQVPQEEWPYKFGSGSEREPPWKRVFRLYMLDLIDLRIITFLNSTFGAVRAVTDVEDRWAWAKALYGADVHPLFRLTEGQMDSPDWGIIRRPAFNIVGWRIFRDGKLRVVDQNVLALDEPKPRSVGETVSDNIPY